MQSMDVFEPQSVNVTTSFVAPAIPLPTLCLEYSDDIDDLPTLCPVTPFPPPSVCTTSSMPLPSTRLFVIEVPPKVWRPKPTDKYLPMDYSDDIDDGVFIFEQYGKSMRRQRAPFVQTRDPSDIHLWDGLRDKVEFDKGFKIAATVDPSARQAVVSIIEENWDCFYSEGVCKPILDFEFCIDTGGSPPVCCRKPHYGPHESKIIMAQIVVLLANGWIEECDGAWGSSVVLAAKPHQESITDIAEFIWRMCVSYRALNQVTMPFEYPIPRCDDAIDNFGDSAGRLYFISLDNKTGYHQIRVCKADQVKLAFFAPDGKKYTWLVMPFGPRNAPAYYTCMMHFFQEEWNALFATRHPALLAHKGSRVIIDDILLWSVVLDVVIKYFGCVVEVFMKYRVTFQLKKCEFLDNRIEYVGHDITPDGNCPAQSKFDLITDWPLPATGQSLISFIGLLTFYVVYCPWFEIRVKPLRALERAYHRKAIPSIEWTPPLRELWEELKVGITSSPCIARYDATLPCFLKTDWSANGMGWVLMQPDNSAASTEALAKLYATGECDFDVTMGGPRLRPVRFGSRKCTDREQHLHSFVGETGGGRWGISQNKKFLWGAEFFWLCDCSAVKEVLEYDGPIHQIKRWAQELLGYHFRVLHRPARMMRDVDGLNRRFDNPLIAQYCSVALALHDADIAARPAAYDPATFFVGNPFKVLSSPTVPDAAGAAPTLPLSDRGPSPSSATAPSSFATIINLPIRFRPAPANATIHAPRQGPSTDNNSSHALLSACTFGWISVTPFLGAIALALQQHNPVLQCVTLICQPEDPTFTPLCKAALAHGRFAPIDLHELSLLCTSIAQQHNNNASVASLSDATQFFTQFPRITGIDFSCPATCFSGQTKWLQSALLLTQTLSEHFHLTCFLIFISLSGDFDCGTSFSLTVNAWLPPGWTAQSGPTSAALYGDCVHAKRWICIGLRQLGMFPPPAASFPPVCSGQSRLGNHVLTELNCVSNVSTPMPASVLLDPSPPSGPAIHPHPIAILRSVDHTAATPSCFVFDPDYPAPEPVLRSGDDLSIYSGSFGIPFTSSFGTNYSRPCSAKELLSFYSAPCSLLQAVPNSLRCPDLSHALALCCPFGLGLAFIEHLADTHLFSALDCTHSSTGVLSRALISKAAPGSRPVPTPTDWTAAYQADPDTKLILQSLFLKTSGNKNVLASIAPGYKEFLRESRISVVEGKLVVFQAVQNNTEFLMLIVVPSGLRRDVFSAYHASPSTGHMGIYKTLHRIRLRFFWPQCRKDITNWVLQCPQCIAINGNVSRNSELIFSWPLCCPFYILHVDLWAPGDIANYRGETYLMNAMCDLTGFVLVNATNDITAGNLARLFVQEVLLKIGFCGLVVVDDGSTFKGLFEQVCLLLGINYHPASPGNHKAVSVEHFHRFLNKALGIAANDRGTPKVFVEGAHTAAYAWNSSPIDGTDIIRSVPAVGRPFRFPFDLSLSSPPTPTQSQAADVHAFLRLAAPTTSFSEQVLRTLTEERRSIHRERANAARNPVAFQIGDLVMARVQVNSNAASGVVAKLSYRKRGPYEIVGSSGFGSYDVRRYGQPDSTVLKYPTQSLSALPPALLPCTPIDTTDFRYLNHSHAPLPHPLKKPFNIQMYNNLWFSKALSTDHPPAFQFHDTPDEDLLPEVNPLSVATIPSAAAIPIVDNADDPSVPKISDTGSALHASIVASVDRLFFISFTPSGTMRPRWFLIQVDLPQTLLDPSSFDHLSSGRYYCHFFGKHPDDVAHPDPSSRFWPLWHRFHTAADGVIEFGSRVLFQPPVIPDPTVYIAWADIIPLLDARINLFGPFNFEEPITARCARTRSSRQILPFSQWASLAAVCASRGILPPVIASTPAIRSRWTKPHSSSTLP
jgi:hypothetical protein